MCMFSLVYAALYSLSQVKVLIANFKIDWKYNRSASSISVVSSMFYDWPSLKCKAEDETFRKY